MDEKTAYYSYSNPQSNNRKFSSNSWPIIKTNTPWQIVDEDSETIYNEAIHRYAEKLQDERLRLQWRLDQFNPKRGAYVNCRGRYLKICERPKDNNGIYATQLNEEANTLVVGYENGFIEMVDLVNECSMFMRLGGGGSGSGSGGSGGSGGYHPPSCIKYNPQVRDHIYISTTSGHVFSCCPQPPEYDTWVISKIISEGKNETYGMDINSTGERLITGGKDSRIRIYDVNTNDIVSCYRGFSLECKDSYTRLLEEDEEEGHYLNIYSIVCHPDNPWLFASAGLDSNIKIWDLRVKQFAVKNIFGPHIMGDAIDLKDNVVLSGQWHSSEGLQLWDSGSCRLLSTLAPANLCPQSFGQYFYCAKFLRGFDNVVSDDVVVAGGAGMDGLIVASFRENQVLAQFEAEGSILCLDSRREMLAYGGSNHTLYVSHFALSSSDVASDSEEYGSAYPSEVQEYDSATVASQSQATSGSFISN